jgi:hypothetical protein
VKRKASDIIKLANNKVVDTLPKFIFFFVRKYNEAPNPVARINPGTSGPVYADGKDVEVPLAYVKTANAP